MLTFLCTCMLYRMINHVGGINRVRSCPQQPALVAVWSDSAMVGKGYRLGSHSPAVWSLETCVVFCQGIWDNVRYIACLRAGAHL
jgi:hypothetical protein